MISMIACMGPHRGIGYKNELIYKSEQDMEWFREITLGATVVMGRKTFESIGHPLKNRTNIILTHQPTDIILKRYGHTFPITSPETILEHYDDFIVIGGASLYEYFLPYAKIIYLNRVNNIVRQADTFFPDFSRKDWRLLVSEDYWDEEIGDNCTREIWKRKKQ